MKNRIDMGERWGKPVMAITQNSNSKYTARISFDVVKAKMILARIEAIKVFVEAYD